MVFQRSFFFKGNFCHAGQRSQIRKKLQVCLFLERVQEITYPWIIQEKNHVHSVLSADFWILIDG